MGLLKGLLLAGSLFITPAKAAPWPPTTPQELRTLLKHEGTPLPWVSAHRGGPTTGHSENALTTFEFTLSRVPALMEVDPRRTRDGAIVLHHDATLDRTTTGQGPLNEHDLSELKSLQLKDPNGQRTGQVIPTLEEAIEWARGKAVLVLDQKEVPAMERASLVARHQAEGFVVLIVYSFGDARAVHQAHPDQVMEVMIPSPAKVLEFEKLGIPWDRVLAFVGHQPPKDPQVFQMLHERGVSCILGTSRNLDRQFLEGKVRDIDELASQYDAFMAMGADLLETDIPVEVGRLLPRWQARPRPGPASQR